jgi:methionyl-tRNA formyltransferase
MRTVFLGTPDIALPTLKLLAASEHRPLGVFTQPAARRSRRGQLESSPVGALARELGIPLHETDSVSTGESLEALQALKPEVIVVVAFGQLLKRAVLELPVHGCINLHPSMLPAYRGAAPVQRAVLEGVVDSGLTVMRLVRKMDAGPILLQKPWRMDENLSAEALLTQAGELGAPMVLDVLGRIGEITPQPQDESRVTFAPPLTKADGVLDFKAPARDLINRVRAVQPWPRAEAHVAGVRMIVHAAEIADGDGRPGQVLAVNQRGIVTACGEGAVCFSLVQLEGKAARPARDVANGLRLKAGAEFQV